MESTGVFTPNIAEEKEFKLYNLTDGLIFDFIIKVVKLGESMLGPDYSFWLDIHNQRLHFTPHQILDVVNSFLKANQRAEFSENIGQLENDHLIIYSYKNNKLGIGMNVVTGETLKKFRIPLQDAGMVSSSLLDLYTKYCWKKR